MSVDTYSAKAKVAASNVDAKMPDDAQDDALAKAMNDINVEDTRAIAVSDNPTGENGLKASPIDPALVDAMRNSRDREFVCRYEKEMENRIWDSSFTQWEVPLMNSWQRLLVHRIADHFMLEHTIDALTKKVTLRKHDATHVPEQSISMLASQERLSEPASNSLSSLLSGRSGTSTPSSIVSAPSGPLNVRIMRRDDMNGEGNSKSTLRSQGSFTPDETAGRKDRRNMTIEEREEAYRQARQRIFGSESEVEAPSLTGESDADSSRGQDRSPTELVTSSTVSRLSQASSSSSSTSSYPRYDERPYDEMQSSIQMQYAPFPSSDMSNGMRSAPSGYPFPVADMHYQPQYYPVGQWYDAYGRPIYQMNQQFPPYGAMNSPNNAGQVPAEYSNPSPSSSSRSTSISAGPDNRDSRQNSITEQGYPNVSSNGVGLSAPVSRSNSTSPSVQYPRPIPSYSGASTPGYQIGPPASSGAWPVYYQHTPPPYVEYQNGGAWHNGQRQIGNASPNTRGWPAPPLPPQGVSGQPYRVYQGQPQTMDPSAFPMMSSRTKASRGRRSQGTERALYDPNKSDVATSTGTIEASTDSSKGEADDASSSARTSSTSSTTPARNGDIPTVPPNSRPFHSSLPARPDWAVAQRGGGSTQSSATSPPSACPTEDASKQELASS